MQAPFDIAADLDTPVSAFLKLGRLRPRFLLESVEGGERLARYSFLGFGDALEVRMDADAFTVDGVGKPRPATQSEYLDALRQALKLAPRPGPEAPGVPFSGGLVGVSGYDVVRLFERLPQNTTPQASIPDAAFVAPASVLVFDHLTRRIALLHDGPESERERLRDEVRECLRGAVPESPAEVTTTEPTGSLTEEEFCARVEACKEHIAAGDIYQIVLSVLFRGKSDVPPFEVYRAMRLINPSPYMFYFDFEDYHVVEAALLADPKEAAEHVMLIDLARNDLGRVARAGSVHVDPYRSIERYSHVMHIVSGVEGDIDTGFDQFDLLAATFPAGTLVGAPKVRAMEIIEDMEAVGRGLYAGTAGYFGVTGDMDQAITIRTLVFSGDEYSFQAGAGIVADSVPAREYQEVLAKSAILRRALQLAGEGI